MRRMQTKVSLRPKDAEKRVSELTGSLNSLKKEECKFTKLVGRRKSVRLAKLAVETSETPMTDDYNNKAPELGENGKNNNSLLIQDEDPSESDESNRKRKGTQPLPSRHVITGSKEAHSSGLAKQFMTEKFQALVEASHELTMQESPGTNNGMEIYSESPRNELVHESLPKIAIIDSTSLSTSIVNASSNKGCAIDLTGTFKKTSSRWALFESEEIFQRIPQRPHFQPLGYIDESRRELEALGQMMNFLAVVEKVSMLHFGDVGTSTTNTILDKLEELETHGFNVVAPRDRVVKLLDLKEKYENVVDFVKDFDSQIEVEEAENEESAEHISEAKENITEIQEQIRKLKDDLLVAQTALLCSQTDKVKRDNRIECLKANRDENEKGTKIIFQEFLTAANSLLL